MFSLENLSFQYEPFPIGLAKPVMEQSAYAELVENYPPQELFADIAKLGHKYSLSERFNSKQYEEFIRSQPAWRALHHWIKSDEFVDAVLEVLRNRYIDLGFDIGLSRGRRLLKMIRDIGRGQINPRASRLRARFEFSMLPADGGHILPHTDSPSKVVTLIVSMLRDGEWDPAFGGGTDVNHPKDIRLAYNKLNRQAGFEDMDVISTYDFTPNQAVVFIKTFNSWHSVQPMRGMGSKTMRKTLTINIESRA